MRREIFEKEEDNLAREQIDRAGGGVWEGGGGGWPPSDGRDFGDFWYKKQLF